MVCDGKDEQMQRMERICKGQSEKKIKKKTQNQMFVKIGKNIKGNKKIKKNYK